MSKLILRCNYLKNSPPAHLANYINYIGTRDGVEKVSNTTALLPATTKQKELIADILTKVPDAKRMHEYHDYEQRPTRENAYQSGIGKQPRHYCEEEKLHRLSCKQTGGRDHRYSRSVF